MTVIVQPTAYDYSQPINTQSPPPSPGVVDQATSTFEIRPRRVGNREITIRLWSWPTRRFASRPTKAALHEFRGLALFALKRYDEAAAALYAVLTVGPGWDWPTLISIYPDVSVYTAQFGP